MASCAPQMVIPRPTDSVSTGELTHVLKNGILVIATDGSYPPQSRRNHDVSRAVTTLGEVVVHDYSAVSIDKDSVGDPIPLVRRISTIIQEMHQDGTLLKFSQKYCGDDFTSPAAKFDLQALAQFP